ncbi:MAG: cysteine hydrolase, partial [Actinomycetes bacterium]
MAVQRRLTRIGPVKAEPYPWPYDGSVPVEKVALVSIDWQIDFCGPDGYVDRMGYD